MEKVKARPQEKIKKQRKGTTELNPIQLQFREYRKKLNSEQLAQHQKDRLCFVCHKSGHKFSDCPQRPKVE